MPTRRNRPLPVTILCVIAFTSWFITLPALIVMLPRLSIPPALLVLQVILFIGTVTGLIGIWRMERRGFYLYASFLAVDTVITMIVFGASIALLIIRILLVAVLGLYVLRDQKEAPLFD